MIGKLRGATLAFGVAVAGLVAAGAPVAQTKDEKKKVEKKQDKGDILKTIKEVTVSRSTRTQCISFSAFINSMMTPILAVNVPGCA